MAPITRYDLHKIFKNLDKDNDGLVSIAELQNLLQKVGIFTNSDELEKLVGQDTLNCLNFTLFYESMLKPGPADQTPDCNDGDLTEAFKVFDLNGDGFITSDELEKVLSGMDLLKKPSGHGQHYKDMIDAYDENSDGVLDFKEFKNMMMTVNPVDDLNAS